MVLTEPQTFQARGYAEFLIEKQSAIVNLDALQHAEPELRVATQTELQRGQTL